MIYSSSVTGAELVAAIKSELDIIPLPSDGTFVRWLCSLEQMVWSEIVRMRRVATLFADGGKLLLDGISVPSDEDGVLACDVCTVYYDGAQVMRGSAEEGFLFAPETAVWHLSGEREITVDGMGSGYATVVYYARPLRRTELAAVIALPDEFTELAASRLKGEAYRAANEDVLATKWLGDYNQKLDAFSLWCDRRRPGGGAV